MKQFVQVYLLRSEYVGPYFVLGNPLEALVYSKMSLNAQVCQQETEKHEFIAKLIKEKSGDFFKVILVSRENKALALQNWLKRNSNIESNIISENLGNEEAVTMVQNWYILGNKAPVMIISDKGSLFSDCNIFNWSFLKDVKIF